MEGGMSFHFVTDGIHSALKRASEAAGGKDVALGGGVSTIQQYLNERLIDEMHLTVAPILLGSGEHLFTGIDMRQLRYPCAKHVPSAMMTNGNTLRSQDRKEISH
jgi:dihydrofolate reductase